jgi:hypothetical protein
MLEWIEQLQCAAFSDEVHAGRDRLGTVDAII